MISICLAGFACLALVMTQCSGPRDKSRISFAKAVAPESVLGEGVKLSRLGCDDQVLAVLDGKTPNCQSSIAYNILYTCALPELSPQMLIVSVQCLESPDKGEATYRDAVEKLSNHPLGLAAHGKLGMKVPATGYWNENPNGQKQIMFHYGNLVIVVQTMYESKIPLSVVRSVADAYVGHLDHVAGIGN